MKYIFFLFLIIKLFAIDLNEYCPYEVKKYPNAKKYYIRFEEYFNKYGCDILVLYNTLDKIDKDYILDYIDENPDTLKYLIKIAKQYPNLLQNLAKNDYFIDFLKQTKYDPKLFKNIFYLLKFIHFYNKKNLGIIYFAAYDSNSPNESYKYYIMLKKIPSKFIPSLSASYFILKQTFPDIKKLDIINSFIRLMYKLSTKELSVLSKYNPFYLTLFLYNPNKVDNFDEYQKELIFIYKKLFKHYYNDKITLNLVQNISPYLIEQDISFNSSFKKLFTDLISNDLFITLFALDGHHIDPCSDDNLFGILSNNNLKKMINFVSIEPALYKQYISDSIYYPNKAVAMFYLIGLANLYDKYYGTSQWKMIKGILKSSLFNKNYKRVERVGLILRLEKIDYFNVLSTKNDYDHFVKVDSEDKNSKNAPKYLYILFTSIAFQNSIPFISIINDENMARKELNKLANMSVEELSEHNFTTLEKVAHFLGIANDHIRVAAVIVSIALAPETGGASLVGLGAIRKMGVEVSKGASIYFIKKPARKMFSKQVSKYYTKTFFNKFNKKPLKDFEDKVDSASDKLDYFNAGFALSLPFFLKNLEFKTLCEREE